MKRLRRFQSAQIEAGIENLSRKVRFKRYVMKFSTGLQIWPFLVVVSKRTVKKCIKIKNARALRVERAEIIVLDH